MALTAQDTIYFNFDDFMVSALSDAITRTNRLAILDGVLRLPVSQEATSSLSNQLSRTSGVLKTIVILIETIGLYFTLAIVAILIAVPVWLLSTALGGFFAGNAPLTVLCVAVLGIGFIATIRKLGQEQDILIAFQHEAQELSMAYKCVKFENKDEFLSARETLGRFDQGQDVDNLRIRVQEIQSKRREIDKLHERAKAKFTDVLIDVVANKAEKLPGFEQVNEVKLRSYLREALCEVQPHSTPQDSPT